MILFGLQTAVLNYREYRESLFELILELYVSDFSLGKVKKLLF